MSEKEYRFKKCRKKTIMLCYFFDGTKECLRELVAQLKLINSGITTVAHYYAESDSYHLTIRDQGRITPLLENDVLIYDPDTKTMWSARVGEFNSEMEFIK